MFLYDHCYSMRNHVSKHKVGAPPRLLNSLNPAQPNKAKCFGLYDERQVTLANTEGLA